MDSQGALWRLMNDFEHLTLDEGVALRDEDFATLEEIHARKHELLDHLAILTQSLRGLGESEQYQTRCENVRARQHANAELAAELLRRLAERREALETANGQVRGVARSYATPTGRTAGIIALCG